MQRYLGLKEINAIPMTRQAYNDFRGWELPSNENGDDKGFLVEYVDGGKANTEFYSGYVSWSPEDVFEKAYRPIKGLDFGAAIELLKRGKKVARSGWNGKGMFLVMQSQTPDIRPYHGSCYANAIKDIKETVTIDAHIDMYTAQGTMQPGWLASQSDVLSEDWEIIE